MGVNHWENLGQEVDGRFKLLEEEKLPVVPDWEDASRYCNKRRTEYRSVDQSRRQNREKPKKQVYSSIPANAAQTMVTSFQGMLISPASRWFRLRPENAQLTDVPYVADWLEAVEESVYNALQNSNFYEAVNEYILDAVVIGTACMLVEEREDLTGGLNFSTRHMQEIYISERDGVVDTVARDFWLQGRVIKSFVDKGKWTIPDRMAQDIENDPYVQHRVINLVMPTDEFHHSTGEPLPFSSVYYLPQHDEVAYTTGFHENPFLVWRWRKNSNEVYGRGPAMDHIDTIKRFNLIAKSMLGLAQKMEMPPKNSPDYLKSFGGSKLLPNYDNYYKEAGLETKIIDLSSGYGPLKDDYIEVRQELLEAFMIPYFLTFSNAEREMTATEVTERMSEKAAILSNVVGRLYQETLNRLLQRVMSTLERAKVLPKLPPPLDKVVEGMVPRLEMVGPLAQAQKRFHQTSGIRDGLRDLGMLAQFDPSVLDIVNFDVLTKEALTADGVPQKGIYEDAEIQKKRKAKQQAMAQQMAMQQAQATAEITNKASKAPEPGSPAELAMNQQNGASQVALSR